jgi:methylamine---glutamate N-methyltransferase subunit C
MTKIENNEENKALCFCLKCPSMNDCGVDKKEILFCAMGAGVCNYKNNGCICGSCKVYRDNKLKNGYYCKKGSSEQIG